MIHTKKEWFKEKNQLWNGRSLSLKIDKHIYSGHSRYQQIDIYETSECGKMLALDGVVQLTEGDEFAYHEMLAHVPMFSHPLPERVLIIG